MALSLGAVDVANKLLSRNLADEFVAKHPSAMESILLAKQGKILYKDLPYESRQIYDSIESYSRGASIIKNFLKAVVLLVFSVIIVFVNRRLA